MGVGELLDIGGNMYGLYLAQVAKPARLRPDHEVPHRPAIGAAGVLVADVRREEVDKPCSGFGAALGDKRRHGDLAVEGKGIGGGFRHGKWISATATIFRTRLIGHFFLYDKGYYHMQRQMGEFMFCVLFLILIRL